MGSGWGWDALNAGIGHRLESAASDPKKKAPASSPRLCRGGGGEAGHPLRRVESPRSERTGRGAAGGGIGRLCSPSYRAGQRYRGGRWPGFTPRRRDPLLRPGGGRRPVGHVSSVGRLLLRGSRAGVSQRWVRPRPPPAQPRCRPLPRPAPRPRGPGELGGGGEGEPPAWAGFQGGIKAPLGAPFLPRGDGDPQPPASFQEGL